MFDFLDDDDDQARLVVSYRLPVSVVRLVGEVVTTKVTTSSAPVTRTSRALTSVLEVRADPRALCRAGFDEGRMRKQKLTLDLTADGRLTGAKADVDVTHGAVLGAALSWGAPAAAAAALAGASAAPAVAVGVGAAAAAAALAGGWKSFVPDRFRLFADPGELGDLGDLGDVGGIEDPSEGQEQEPEPPALPSDEELGIEAAYAGDDPRGVEVLRKFRRAVRALEVEQADAALAASRGQGIALVAAVQSLAGCWSCPAVRNQ